jgi:hypothetical protein
MMDRKMTEADVDPEQLQDVESRPAQEFRLDVLSSFLCMVIERRMDTGSNLSEEISQVAEELNTSVPLDVLNRRDWPSAL